MGGHIDSENIHNSAHSKSAAKITSVIGNITKKNILELFVANDMILRLSGLN